MRHGLIGSMPFRDRNMRSLMLSPIGADPTLAGVALLQCPCQRPPSTSRRKKLLKSPEFVMIPFSSTPGPHQIAIAVAIGVQPGAVLGAHGASARTADGESLYLNRRRQPLERARIAVHFPPHQVIARRRHIGRPQHRCFHVFLTKWLTSP